MYLNREKDLVFQKNANRIFIPAPMVIYPEGGFIKDHIYFIKEMKIEVQDTVDQLSWFHVVGTSWHTLGSNLLLGHLKDKSFYVTKIRLVEYD